MFTFRSRRAEDMSSDPAASSGLRERYESWRFRRDLAAIMAALDRLSDRRLEMIGIRRDDLFEAVSDMMMRAEEERAIGREVMALLDTPKAKTPAAAVADGAGVPQSVAA
ncbi:hypothetical protein OCH239_04065 [Roseivivax halodurans JCM 10272]|uniref:DUF1127 domain-containing protein n=1 Tax=Roseivivax halodurans JCM 10272 TaxID=1449350 RepID=X7EEF3_9RHOB|nr:hypothetical protein [Roseivivax halodurans]ETX14307.1 hypothetical protein OCH239_04065 [Roseivivax halodurans JCM 10272]